MLLKTNQLQWLQLDPITFTFAPSLTSLLPLAVPDATVQPATEMHPVPSEGGTSDAAADRTPRESLRSRLTKFLGNFQKQMLAHQAFAADRARCKAGKSPRCYAAASHSLCCRAATSCSGLSASAMLPSAAVAPQLLLLCRGCTPVVAHEAPRAAQS